MKCDEVLTAPQVLQLKSCRAMSKVWVVLCTGFWLGGKRRLGESKKETRTGQMNHRASSDKAKRWDLQMTSKSSLNLMEGIRWSWGRHGLGSN